LTVLLACATAATAQQDGAQAPAPVPARRGLPAAFDSPPFPSSEYQGYPLVGVPPSATRWPLEQSLLGELGAEPSRLRAYGWITASANASSARDSNLPSSYWLVPNSVQLEQAVLRFEREVDSVQQDEVDWGFRATFLYGTNYRWMTAGGWFSDQLLERNELYGFDPTELYVDLYVPGLGDGTVLRAGRWVACPDIETQFAPDNYMATHSLLFTHDTYTQTGVMVTTMLDPQWTVQAGVHAGTDMAPWYEGATATGMLGVRWTAADNDDSVYLVLNAINEGKFRRFEQDGRPAGADNFNYLVGTWQHRFDRDVHSKLESYVLWQEDTVVGGRPSLGPVRSFGGGGGLGADIPGTTFSYGLLNYTMVRLAENAFWSVRNEWWRDEDGARAGTAGNYTSHGVGLSWEPTPRLMLRPEVVYYRNWDRPAFDLGTDRGLLVIGFDLTWRF
jgi:hypothetical protein